MPPKKIRPTARGRITARGQKKVEQDCILFGLGALRPRLCLRKVILIRPLEDVGLASGDADAVVDHEFGEALAVDEDDLVADLVDEFAGTGGEPSGARQTGAKRQPEGRGRRPESMSA